MFDNHFTTNFLQNATVKKFWKSVNIWQRYGQILWLTFLGHPVQYCRVGVGKNDRVHCDHCWLQYSSVLNN